MINCIVVDDEKHARVELIYQLSKFENINVIENFDNGEDALNFIKSTPTDIIFLDITMNGLSGIELAKLITNLNLKNTPHIVFVTAYNEYAVKAFELNAIDYILKPINENRFKKCIEKISTNITKDTLYNNKIANLKTKKSNECEIISLSKNDAVYPIKKKHIKLVYIKNRELIIETTTGTFYLSETLNNFEKNLPSDLFMRVHRSFLINMDYIEKIIPWFNSTYKVKLCKIDLEIPISRNKTQEFKNRMLIL